MALEECRICGEDVPYDASVHVMMHADAVEDCYVCRSCYDEELAGLIAE